MAHLQMTGWPRTACNRDTIFNNATTTTDPEAMTCEVCRKRWARLQKTELYAGEAIPVAQIDYWASLARPYRFRFCRRFTETQSLQGFHWYQFSRKQRLLLLSEMRKQPDAAWFMGLPGTEQEPIAPAELKPIWRKVTKIIQGVRAGRQPVEHLERALELQAELARRVFK